jgi:hypothetical protein
MTMTPEKKYQVELEYALHAFGEAVRNEEMLKRAVVDAERNRERAREDLLRMIAERPSQESK